MVNVEEFAHHELQQSTRKKETTIPLPTALCFRLIEICPDEGCLLLDVGGKPIYNSKNWLKKRNIKERNLNGKRNRNRNKIHS